ncbi:MAG: hypothetical protein R3F24_09715 [Gammaproteobacteria bacterium]
MRIPTLLALMTLTFGFATASDAACDYPSQVKIPPGKTATEAEITATSATVKKYLADLDAYMKCIDAESAAVPVEEQTDESKALHVKRYNAAVDAMEAAAAAFNTELRAYKAAHP